MSDFLKLLEITLGKTISVEPRANQASYGVVGTPLAVILRGQTPTVSGTLHQTVSEPVVVVEPSNATNFDDPKFPTVVEEDESMFRDSKVFDKKFTQKEVNNTNWSNSVEVEQGLLIVQAPISAVLEVSDEIQRVVPTSTRAVILQMENDIVGSRQLSGSPLTSNMDQSLLCFKSGNSSNRNSLIQSVFRGIYSIRLMEVDRHFEFHDPYAFRLLFTSILQRDKNLSAYKEYIMANLCCRSTCIVLTVKVVIVVTECEIFRVADKCEYIGCKDTSGNLVIVILALTDCYLSMDFKLDCFKATTKALVNFNKLPMPRELLLLILGVFFFLVTCLSHVHSNISIPKLFASYLAGKQREKFQAVIQQVQNSALRIVNVLILEDKDFLEGGNIDTIGSFHKKGAAIKMLKFERQQMSGMLKAQADKNKSDAHKFAACDLIYLKAIAAGMFHKDSFLLRTYMSEVVEVNDPYSFRLLVMGNNNVVVRGQFSQSVAGHVIEEQLCLAVCETVRVKLGISQLRFLKGLTPLVTTFVLPLMIDTLAATMEDAIEPRVANVMEVICSQDIYKYVLMWMLSNIRWKKCEQVLMKYVKKMISMKEFGPKTEAVWSDFRQTWFTRSLLFRNYQELVGHCAASFECVQNIVVASHATGYMDNDTLDDPLPDKYKGIGCSIFLLDKDSEFICQRKWFLMVCIQAIHQNMNELEDKLLRTTEKSTASTTFLLQALSFVLDLKLSWAETVCVDSYVLECSLGMVIDIAAALRKRALGNVWSNHLKKSKDDPMLLKDGCFKGLAFCLP